MSEHYVLPADQLFERDPSDGVRELTSMLEDARRVVAFLHTPKSVPVRVKMVQNVLRVISIAERTLISYLKVCYRDRFSRYPKGPSRTDKERAAVTLARDIEDLRWSETTDKLQQMSAEFKDLRMSTEELAARYLVPIL